MAMGSNEDVVARVNAIKGYTPLFEQAFGDEQIIIDRITKAIAAYERTIISGNRLSTATQLGTRTP